MGYLDSINSLLGKKKPVDEDKKLAAKPQVKALIVEDEAILREMYRDKLKHEGFDVRTASNGEEGLDAAINDPPDVLLLDLMMPVMNGQTMLRRLRHIHKFKRLPVIILTNAGDVENIRETQHFENANEFFIKSNVSVDDVVKKIKELTAWV